MTNNEFLTALNKAFAEHPMLAKSNPKSINELLYVLRMEFDNDFCISIPEKNGAWSCIPSSRETFISTKMLARKIDCIEYEEEKDEELGTIYCLTIYTT